MSLLSRSVRQLPDGNAMQPRSVAAFVTSPSVSRSCRRAIHLPRFAVETKFGGIDGFAAEVRRRSRPPIVCLHREAGEVSARASRAMTEGVSGDQAPCFGVAALRAIARGSSGGTAKTS